VPPDEAPETHVYRVSADGAQGVLVGERSVQYNIFNQVTWSDGVAPDPLVGVSGAIDSPYRGLQAFGEADAAFFCGRETAVADVLARLSDCLSGAGFLVVSGVSGAGKTSLLRAGILPRLSRAGLPGVPAAAAWPRVLLVPGAKPLDELAVRIAPAARANAASIRPDLTTSPAAFALTARQAGADGRIVLVVDQFETVFTQCEREGERQAFITALHAAAASGAALVVLSIRADLEARLGNYQELEAAVQGRYLLTAMTERQLRLAITQPATAAGASVDDDLVEALVRETQGRTRSPDQPGGGPQAIGAGALPLLSYALDQAWRHRTGQAVTLADYERTGGIEYAVASSAQRAFERLTVGQQAVARQVFTRLTATTPDGIDTAVRVARADLAADKDRARDVETVLELFAAERLLTLAAGFVEISHEVLLTAWPLLRDDWLAETRAERAIRARLTATVTEWSSASRDRSYLYTGSRLEAAERATARIAADERHTALARDEADFLRVSRRAVSRSARLRRGFTAVVAVLAAGLAIALAIVTQTAGDLVRERDSAQAATATAVSGRLVSDSLAEENTDPGLARLESAIAWHLDETAQARYALLEATSNPLASVLTAADPPVSVAYNPADTMLAVGEVSSAGTAAVQLVNAATGMAIGSPLIPAGSTGITTQLGWSAAVPVAFSPDDTTLAVGTGNVVTLWNVATHRVTARFVSLVAGLIGSLAFSPDGRTLVVGAGMCLGHPEYAGCAELWSASTGKEIGVPFDSESTAIYGGTLQVAFSPDGATVATGGNDGVVRLWSTATQRQEGPAFTKLGYVITSLEFSPDGRTLATGSGDGQVRLWNAATGRQVGQSLSGGSGTAVDSVAFDPTGTLIAEGGSGGTVKVWDVATREQVGAALSGGTDGVSAVAFSPSDETLASTDADSTVRLWTMATLTGRPADLPLTPVYPLYSNGGVIAGGMVYADQLGTMAFSPSGTLAIFDGAGSIGFWEVAGGNTNPDYPTVSLPQRQYSTIALSPNGRTLAAGMGNDTVQLSDPVKVIKTIPAPKGVSDSTIEAMAFSPDGRELAVSYYGQLQGPLQLIDVATGRPTASIQPAGGGASNPFLSVAFGPGGTVLTVDNTGIVSTWSPLTSARTGLPVSQFAISGDNGPLRAAAFSPDGSTLALGYRNDTVQLWDLVTRQQIGVATASLGQTLESLAFNDSGTVLAVGGVNGSSAPLVMLWNVGDLDAQTALLQACAAVGGVSTAEWSHYVPGLPYEKVCP
jgi:WD40 repeat protein